MRTLSRPDQDGPGLTGLRLGIERAAAMTRTGRLDVTELRAAVEADLEHLGTIGGSLQLPEVERHALLVTTDTVASHLLAALDAAVAGVRPEVVADLLQRAADRLDAEAPRAASPT